MSTVDALQAYARDHGKPLEVTANRPLILDDPDAFWVLAEGLVNIFVSARTEEGETGRLGFIQDARAGDILLGSPAQKDAETSAGNGTLGNGALGNGALGNGALGNGAITQQVLIARGVGKAQLFALPLARTLSNPDPLICAALQTAIERWIARFSAGAASLVPSPSITEERLLDEQQTCFSQGVVLRSDTRLLWCAGLGSDDLFLDTVPLRPGSDDPPPFPIVDNGWVRVTEKREVQTFEASQFPTKGQSPTKGELPAKSQSPTKGQSPTMDPFLVALRAFQEVTLRAAATGFQLLATKGAALRWQEIEKHKKSRSRAQLLLEETLQEEKHSREDPLDFALSAIGEEIGVRFSVPAGPQAREYQAIRETVRSAGVRVRLNRLGKRWRRLGDQPMLGFLKEGLTPVALFWSKRGRYCYQDPVTGNRIPVTPKIEKLIHPNAYSFYPCFPRRPLRFSDIRALAPARAKWTLSLSLLAGMGGALLSLTPAWAWSRLASDILPFQAAPLLQEMISLLLVAAAGLTLFYLIAGASIARLGSQWRLKLDAALMDRLLSLPTSFLRNHRTASLGSRLAALRDFFSEKAWGTFFFLASALPALCILLFLSPALALTAGLFTLLWGMLICLIGYRRLGLTREDMEARNRTVSELFGHLKGITKLRATHSEERIFHFWARNFRQEMGAARKVWILDDLLVTLSALATPLGFIALFATCSIWISEDGLQASEFLAIQAGLLFFVAALASMTNAVPIVAAAVAGYHGLRPILDQAPESSGTGSVAASLSGAISVEEVSHQYEEGGPMALKGVSLKVGHGEFVAVVGPSGSGKSSLLHLILGGSRPTKGTIQFDGRDLSSLNPYLLRRQIGIVTQDAPLHPGSIFDNIAGHDMEASLEDAWEAARLAGIEEEIKALPMGIFTGVGETSYTLSGSQRQRLRLAAALIHKPRILLLDEPTSWLDNKTQAEIVRRLEKLPMTRLVVAQRLETVAGADRIYVLRAGEIVQTGAHDELLSYQGPFRELQEPQE